MRPLLRLFSLFSFFIVPSVYAQQKADTLIWYVDATQKPCTGVGPMHCLQIRVHPDSSWQLFYGTIKGFNFKSGFSYRIVVEKTAATIPIPADGSAFQYRLIETLNKTKVKKSLPINGSWAVISLQDKPIPSQAIGNIRLDADGKMGGLAFCNRFFGTYKLGEGGKVTLSPAGVTRMMCPENLNQLEQQFLDLLKSVVRFEVKEQVLLFFDEGGKTIVTLKKVPNS